MLNVIVTPLFFNPNQVNPLGIRAKTNQRTYTVSIFSVGVEVKGKNQFFDTNRLKLYMDSAAEPVNSAPG